MSEGESVIRFLLSVLGTAAAFWVVTTFLPGVMTFEGEATQLILLALIFGVVNGLIGPIVKLLALPLTVVTLGLIGFLINAGLLLLVAGIAGAMGIDFHVGDFPPDLLGSATLISAVIGALVLSIVNAVIQAIVPG
jgi:putative membrane protein